MSTRLTKLIAVSVVLITFAATSGLASAALISYEPFEGYNGGNLVGQSPNGLGYDSSGTWADGVVYVQSTSVPYPGLPVAGGSAYYLPITDTTQAPLDVAAFGALAESGSSVIGGGSVSGDLYIGFTYQAVKASGTYCYSGMTLTGNNTELVVAKTWCPDYFGVQPYQGLEGELLDSNNNTLLADDSAHYFVVKIGFNANDSDSITVWLDPDLTLAEGDQDTFMYDHPYAADYSFSGIGFRGNYDYFFDEIRMGTEWSDMGGGEVPEPSTLALLGCCLAGLLAYAWKKRK